MPASSSRRSAIAASDAHGEYTRLAEYRGNVLLIVNVASNCGLTPQYAALERLYEEYGPRGLVILGFPANDFGSQEPGSDGEIQEFCATNFGVTFPMFSKIVVTGSEHHPLYERLVEALPVPTFAQGSDFRDKLKLHGIEPARDSDVLWNFEKFLVGNDGKILARF